MAAAKHDPPDDDIYTHEEWLARGKPPMRFVDWSAMNSCEKCQFSPEEIKHLVAVSGWTSKQGQSAQSYVSPPPDLTRWHQLSTMKACSRLALATRGRQKNGNGAEPFETGELVGRDMRPKIVAPYPDAPITPIMELLDKNLSTDEPEPPMRNVHGPNGYGSRAQAAPPKLA